MNNFELDKKAKELADTHTPYRLAKMYLTEKMLNEEVIECGGCAPPVVAKRKPRK